MESSVTSDSRIREDLSIPKVKRKQETATHFVVCVWERERWTNDTTMSWKQLRTSCLTLVSLGAPDTFLLLPSLAIIYWTESDCCHKQVSFWVGLHSKIILISLLPNAGRLQCLVWIVDFPAETGASDKFTKPLMPTIKDFWWRLNQEIWA